MTTKEMHHIIITFNYTKTRIVHINFTLLESSLFQTLLYYSNCKSISYKSKLVYLLIPYLWYIITNINTVIILILWSVRFWRFYEIIRYIVYVYGINTKKFTVSQYITHLSHKKKFVRIQREICKTFGCRYILFCLQYKNKKNVIFSRRMNSFAYNSSNNNNKICDFEWRTRRDMFSLSLGWKPTWWVRPGDGYYRYNILCIKCGPDNQAP